LVVASPTRLVGAERTFFGDSDDVTYGPKDYKLINAELLFGGDLYVSKKEKEMLEEIAPLLLEMSEVDIKDCRAPESAKVERMDDERGRWDLMLTPTHRLGTVIRTGEGSKKRYMLYLWDGGWYLVHGQPCYDLPMFGLPELRARPDAPVMIHEGPKALAGAWEAARSAGDVGRLANWMSLYSHAAWHGSDIGMEWTDWSPLRGRRVLIWPDMDEAGLLYARRLARRLARMGGIIEYVQWSVSDIEDSPTWDWGDSLSLFMKQITRTEIRERLQKVESPIDEAGNIHEEWAKRSFYDTDRQEVYMLSKDFRPWTMPGIRTMYGPSIAAKIADSEVNPFIGTDFRPGLPYGRMKNGKINMCPPQRREPIQGAPLRRAVYETLVHGWLGRMVPNVQQRKHLIRRAAWAVARPEKNSQHMIVLQGESGIGKSVLLDLIVRVAGDDRAIALFPDSILSKFNAAISFKSVVCIHEIHSDDISRKQNASRLKELVANEVIITEEKNRPRVSHTNVIHWFAATNEKVPFSLEHGNDRFFFVKCVSPQDAKAVRRKDRFFHEWLPKFHDNMFLDELYAAAKWLVGVLPDHRVREMTGRARRQATWSYLEKASMRPWEQFLYTKLLAVMEQEPEGGGDGHPPCFWGHEIVNLVMKHYPGRGPIDVQQKMADFGYRTLRDKGGNAVRRRAGPGTRLPIWCRADHLSELTARGDFGSLQVRSLLVGPEQRD
jgi:hypothetical protein